mgnify:CR=1 FL=1
MAQQPPHRPSLLGPGMSRLVLAQRSRRRRRYAHKVRFVAYKWLLGKSGAAWGLTIYASIPDRQLNSCAKLGTRPQPAWAWRSQMLSLSLQYATVISLTAPRCRDDMILGHLPCA